MLKTFMHPFSDQPSSGKQVRVYMKDGSTKMADTTHVMSSTFDAIQWYCQKTREAIDINEIKGWVYVSRDRKRKEKET